MKKTVAIIITVVVLAAAALGIYFGFFAGEEEPSAAIAIYPDSFILSDSTVDTYLSEPEKYRKSLSVSYGLSDELASDFLEAPENWLAFEMILNLENTSDKSMTILGYKINNNGKNGIYASTAIGGELTLSPRAAYPVALRVLCNDGDISSEEARELVEKLDIDLIYGETVDEDDEISVTMTAKVNKEK